MQYQTTINNITTLLNQKGRSKKGANGQENFIKLLSVLKTKFNKEVSTTFLMNLMDNKRTRTQKNNKIRNLCKGLNREKRSLDFRGLDVLSYKADITEYEYKKGYTAKKTHLKREVKTPKIKTTKKGVAYIDYSEQKDLRDIGGFVCEKKGINFNVRSEPIGREFICSSKKTFNFIRV